MVNTVWIIKRMADFPEFELIDEEDVIILIQDAVLRTPTIENWYACEEDTIARNVKISKEKLVSYTDIIDIIEKANKVVVW